MIKNFLWQTRYLLSMILTRGRVKGLLFGFIFILFLFWAAAIPALLKASGGVYLPELFLTKSTINWQQFLDVLNPVLKKLYLSRYLPLDMLFPFVYGFLFAHVLIFLGDRIFELTSNYKLLYYVPLAAADFDLLENILSAIAIVRAPAVNQIFLKIIVFVTFVKFILLTLSLLMVLSFFIIYKKRTA